MRTLRETKGDWMVSGLMIAALHMPHPPEFAMHLLDRAPRIVHCVRLAIAFDGGKGSLLVAPTARETLS
ncbi:hypothetical protein D9M69_584040 [compost metagenome]